MYADSIFRAGTETLQSLADLVPQLQKLLRNEINTKYRIADATAAPIKAPITNWQNFCIALKVPHVALLCLSANNTKSCKYGKIVLMIIHATKKRNAVNGFRSACFGALLRRKAAFSASAIPAVKLTRMKVIGAVIDDHQFPSLECATVCSRLRT